MLKHLLTSAGRVYNFLISLIVAIVLGVATWASWGFYQDSRLQSQFAREGKLLSVTVEQASQKQRSWRDIMSNSTYLSFPYQGKTYTTRFVMDSGYVGSGDRVRLLYHPDYDAFRQPNSEVHFDQSKRKSRLIDWTSVRDFSNENKLLLLCLVLTTAAFFMITGVILTLIPLSFLQDIARFILVVELVIAAVFFTYDTWNYYQYYQHIKTSGQAITVKVLDTERRSKHRNSRSRSWREYVYEATIRYQQQERVIPISEDDFDRLKPNDSLKAYYDESVDDFMSVDYSLDYEQVLVPLFFWLISFILIRPFFVRKKPNMSYK
jgi:predicted negative regulator of RcsB-dependent stress response